jgi:hypothetical protein
MRSVVRRAAVRDTSEEDLNEDESSGGRLDFVRVRTVYRMV